jgi:amino acid adenylation domain-containing protein
MRSADRLPDTVAIEAESHGITYRTINAVANRLAGVLLSLGTQPGDAVCVVSESTSTFVFALLACLRSGTVFAPVDTTLPVYQRTKIISKLKARWLVCDSRSFYEAAAVMKNTAYEAQLICVGQAPEPIVGAIIIDPARADDPGPPPLRTAAEDPGYIYFTSGSTGEPKGILGSSAGIDHFVQWEVRRFELAGTRVSQLVPPSFDAFLRDVCTPLAAGGTICVPPTRKIVGDPMGLLRWLGESRVELVHTVASVFRRVLQLPLQQINLPALRHVLLSGEAVRPADVTNWFEKFGADQLMFNLYGPTETIMVKTCHQIVPADANAAVVPIGLPIQDVELSLLDARGRPVDQGDIGEILIGVPFRLHGYYEDPTGNAAAFRFTTHNGVLYRTGDLGRQRSDGNFEVLGRLDSQIKINGVRVEVGEIENVIASHPAIKEVVVVAQDKEAADHVVLTAYVVVRESFEIAELRAFVRDRLGDFAVPAKIATVPSIIRTYSGKIDRIALARFVAGRGGIRTAYQSPISETESLIVDIWQRLLAVQQVGTRDRFDDWGGDSMFLARLSVSLIERFGIEVPIAALLRSWTVEEQAILVDSIRNASDEEASEEDA